MPMPRQKPGRSKQDYGTPPELVAAIERRFGALTWDCAARPDNTLVAGRFFSDVYAPELENAFAADWSKLFTRRDLLFLNPEFGKIGSLWAPLVGHWTRSLPWLRLIFLTPASLASEWYQAHVEDRAIVNPLSPRLQFVGADDPYPKDCMISIFGFGVSGVRTWRWDGTTLAPPPKLHRMNALAAVPGMRAPKALPPPRRLAAAPARTLNTG